MNRQFLVKFISVNSLASILIESFGTFMVSIALTKFLDPAARGEYSNFIAFIFLFGFIGTNVHNRAVYFSNSSRNKNYLGILLSSLITSTIVFSTAGILVLNFVNKYSVNYLMLIFFGSIGTSLFTFISVNLSIQHNHKDLRRFITSVFGLQIISIILIVEFKNKDISLIMYLLTIWIPIALLISILIRNKSLGKYRLSIPSIEFIKNNLFPRIPSLPIYLSIFDSLKLDLILCNFFLGYQATGNYVLATTFSVSLQFICKYISLVYFKEVSIKSRLQNKQVPWRLFFVFLAFGLAVGLTLMFSLSYILHNIFTNGYSINSLDFLLIWFGNLFYWGRRLIADLTSYLQIDKWIGISELVGAVSFISLLYIITPNNLYDFSRIYSFSLLLPLIVIILVAIKISSNLKDQIVQSSEN